MMLILSWEKYARLARSNGREKNPREITEIKNRAMDQVRHRAIGLARKEMRSKTRVSRMEKQDNAFRLPTYSSSNNITWDVGTRLVNGDIFAALHRTRNRGRVEGLSFSDPGLERKDCLEGN